MNIIDISWPITENMTAYKDCRSVMFSHMKNFSCDNVRESKISLSSHTGTHIDAPAHFLSDGATIDTIVLECLIGPCSVLDLTHVCDAITQIDLEQYAIKSGNIILLKTANSARETTAPFDSEFVFLEKSGAQYLADCGIKSVGIDYLGIERSQPAHETHKILLAANIPIIEGLRLKNVLSGNYIICCLPIAVIGLEAAIARAVLISNF